MYFTDTWCITTKKITNVYVTDEQLQITAIYIKQKTKENLEFRCYKSLLNNYLFYENLGACCSPNSENPTWTLLKNVSYMTTQN